MLRHTSRMKRAPSFFLLLSLAAHIAALVALFLLIRPVKTERPQEQIEFEVVLPAASNANLQATSSSRKMHQPKRSGKTKALGPADLQPRWNWKKGEKSAESSDFLSQENKEPAVEFDPHGEGGAYGHMESTGLEQATQEMPFFQMIWKQIDQFMDFPEEIARMRISGQVVVHLKLNRQGQMVGDFQRIHSDAPVLKTYALLVLMQGLKNPLPGAFHLPEGHQDIPVVMTFHFRAVSVHGLDNDHGDFFKNALLFRRTVYVDPVLNERLNYILTKYMPPVIPFPGGVYVDFIRAYQMVHNYTHDVPDFYDQRQRQFELLRDQLERTLQKKQSP